MKSSFFASLLSATVLITASSFVSALKNGTTFSIEIEGVENFNMKDGISISEFSPMIIKAEEKGVGVEEFEIYLGRDDRSVYSQLVFGDKFDLAELSNHARSGDRVVIELTEVNGFEEEYSEGVLIMTFPVK